ncbi:MAG: hypothetical protein V1862_10700 [Methanobacteriota archaeon]
MLTLTPFKRYTFSSGTDLLSLRHRLTENEIVSGRTVASGNLRVSEYIGNDPRGYPLIPS